jgi:cation diffusion facilitator family transporter
VASIRRRAPSAQRGTAMGEGNMAAQEAVADGGKAKRISADKETKGLYKLLWWGFIIEIPIVIMTVVTAVLASSAALIAMAAESGVALVINGFALYSTHQVMRENVYAFPYGAGKLENFSAFLCGALYLPSGLFVMYDSVERLIEAPEVGYLIGLIPVAITFITGTSLYYAATRLKRRTLNPSPLLRSYRLDYLTGMLTDGGIIVAFVLATIIVGMGYPAIGDRIDPGIALAVSIYMLWAGVSLVRENFRALMDLPLSEQEQMAIMGVLALHFSDYDEVGAVRSRLSGKRRFVDIELGFDGTKTLDEVNLLSRHMEHDLAQKIPDLDFRITPLWKPKDSLECLPPAAETAAAAAEGE